MMLVHLVLVFIMAGLVSAGSPLELICKNKDIQLTTRSEFEALVEETEMDMVICPGHVIATIKELSEIMNQYEGKNVCTMDLALRLRDLYLDRLDTSDDSNKVTRWTVAYKLSPYDSPKWLRYKKVPKALKRFALAYAMLVVNKCKWNMLEELTGEKRVVLQDSDYESLHAFTKSGGPLSRVLDNITQPSEITLPSDLVMIMSSRPWLRKPPSKLYIQTEHAERIELTKMFCSRRFKPIYESLMLPVAVLGQAGIDYTGHVLKGKLEEPENAEIIKKWSRYVFLCEALEMIEPVAFENPESESRLESNKKKQRIRALSEAEAAEIKKRLASEGKTETDATGGVTQFVYKPSPVLFDEELIVDEANKRLMDAIEYIKNRRNNNLNAKGKTVRRGLKKLVGLFVNGKASFSATDAIKASWKFLTKKYDTPPPFTHIKDEDSSALVNKLYYTGDNAFSAEIKMEASEVIYGLLVVLSLGTAMIFFGGINKTGY